MGGGGSKALEKKRAKEFAASDDDDDDDPERTEMHISRSLYKILNGNLATVKLPKPSETLSAPPSCLGEPRLDLECHPGRPGATHLSKIQGIEKMTVVLSPPMFADRLMARR
jgi:hypothetical protein